MRVKEFLSARGVDFESISVNEPPGHWAELEEKGFASVPVVTIDEASISGIDLFQVAEKLGMSIDEAPILDQATLLHRISTFLSLIAIVAPQIHSDFLAKTLAGRQRTILQLLNHQVELVRCFIAVMKGAVFDESMANAEPDREASVSELASVIPSLNEDLQSLDCDWSDSVTTYFGQQTRLQILERCTWHIAQHLRQLQHFLDDFQPDIQQWLDPSLLNGLPLPQGVWEEDESTG